MVVAVLSFLKEDKGWTKNVFRMHVNDWNFNMYGRYIFLRMNYREDTEWRALIVHIVEPNVSDMERIVQVRRDGFALSASHHLHLKSITRQSN